MGSAAIEIEKLSTEERLRLIEELWESLRSHPKAVPITDAQRQELDHRLDEFDRGDVEAIPWDEVKPRIRDGVE